MVPAMLTLTVFPEFARAAAASQQQFTELLRQFVRVVVTVGLPVAVVLAFVAGPLIVLLFGSDFASAADVLVILAISPVFIAVDQAFTMALLANGYEQLDLWVLACACAFYALALWVVIPALGV